MHESLELNGDATFGSVELTVHASGDLPAGTIARVNFNPLMRLDTSTPDGRYFAQLGFSSEPTPLPLLYKDRTTSTPGHDGARIAGTLRQVDVSADGVVSGWGYLIDNQAGRDALLALQTGAVKGTSADLRECALDAQQAESLGVRYAYGQSKLAGVTIVPIPAFPDAVATLDGALVASASIQRDLRPPRDAFDNPRLTGPTGIRVVPLTSEFSQVFGHLATWDQPHIGVRGHVTPPRDDDFSYFYSGGTVLCDDGSFVPVGRIFIGGDHPDVQLAAQQALDAYAATCLAWADIRVGRDAHGIWFAGVTRPSLTEELTYAARASSVSGDWRPISGRKRLVAVLSCNRAGFPVVENSSTGDFALIASGPPPEDAAEETIEEIVVEEVAPEPTPAPTPQLAVVKGGLFNPIRIITH